MSQKHTPQLWVPAVKVLSIGNDLLWNISIALIYFEFECGISFQKIIQ